MGGGGGGEVVLVDPGVVVAAEQREVQQAGRPAVDPVFEVMAICATTCVKVADTAPRRPPRLYSQHRVERGGYPSPTRRRLETPAILHPMSMLATHHFSMNGLWVSGSALGLTHSVTYRDHKCTVHLPSRPRDFGLDKYTNAHHPAIGAYWGQGGLLEADHLLGPSEWVKKAAVLLVRVDVEMEGDLTAEQMPSGVKIDREISDVANKIMSDSADIARSLVATFFVWARVQAHQHWLDPQQQVPRATWRSELRDAAGHQLATGYNEPLVFGGIEDEQHVTATELELFLDLASHDVAPPMPETLLADAFFYAWQASPANPQLGLMLAAIGCETKIKAFLTEIAQPSQLELVDLVLENPRDVSLAAVRLFDKALLAVAGVSLREDNKVLYNSISTLFEHRNRFAHRGDPDLDAQAIGLDLNAARDVFHWLDEQSRLHGVPSND